jgi:hypothetical protein
MCSNVVYIKHSNKCVILKDVMIGSYLRTTLDYKSDFRSRRRGLWTRSSSKIAMVSWKVIGYGRVFENY